MRIKTKFVIDNNAINLPLTAFDNCYDSIMIFNNLLHSETTYYSGLNVKIQWKTSEKYSHFIYVYL